MVPHLAHEETSGPHGSLASDFFAKIMTSSPTNPGEKAEAENLIRLYIGDTIKESTLWTHTMGAPQDVQMPQSSSKRGRDDAEDMEDTGTYPGHPHTANPAEGDSTPQQDPLAITEAETTQPSTLHLREEALTAFLAYPMLRKPEQLELNHISALLALLVEGAWGETVTHLISAPMQRKKASTIWNT